ncbi:EscU/YscU/HrcU family type III secretion system export apparatus switch protein [Loktanella sp. S4079]|uniref:EscU/YscU/HrcU family type III secretion system export apparatus switch protein n=1 Tax=Loktanella sp. S4079 TaxID=579483 RepID=UPI0005FA4DFD|nr:flagellar type III secretion system protein FlhB [Loktanella sp. S4079]KJZ21155.1 flagellar biosynthesis protein FlhB [Loktanella sp. S4079]
MSEQGDESDKQFEASQKKLDDARKKGELVKSADLTTAAGYAGFLLVGITFGSSALTSLAEVLAVMLGRADSLSQLMFDGSGVAVQRNLMSSVFLNSLPWFAGPALCALLAVIAQRAFVVTGSKLAPKLSRISMISGLKNKFGRQGLFEFVKSFAKLLIYCIVLGLFLSAQSDRIVGSLYHPPARVVSELGQLMIHLMFIVAVIAAILGGIDYLWQRAEFMRKNRMSRKEMTDEHKESEGDPMMKQQRRMKGQAIAMNKMLTDVPTADVIIVNPTHYAVALKWDRNSGNAPTCVAKGVDEVAAKIRELAFEHGVPVHSDPPTARVLHAGVEIGQVIAPEHYRAVAAAIRFAEKMRTKVYRS